MDKKLKSNVNESRVLRELDELISNRRISEKFQAHLLQFYHSTKDALIFAGQPLEPFYREFILFLQLVEKEGKTPFSFAPYHQKVRSPIDYYRFSIEFFRLLIDLERSKVFGLDVVDRIQEQLNRKENVILLANHQVESDPQAIALLLEKTHPEISDKIIIVAGERVVTDPLAIPFSMGCNLLCIYSKRYIDHPIELKDKKQKHNQQTMERMSRLLSEGAKIIYVAPSGGRDRKNKNGEIEVAPFDPRSIEMFYLMARKAKTKTHFYPLVLSTYNLLPPPETIQRELGESRRANYTPIYLRFLPEFDMESFPGSEETNKTKRRQNRATAIWELVKQEHNRLLKIK